MSFQTPSYSHTLTPNLDKLAKAGVVLGNHHVQPVVAAPKRDIAPHRRTLLPFRGASMVVGGSAGPSALQPALRS